MNRGTFHQRYSQASNKEPGRTNYRLLDCMLTVAPLGDPDYLLPPKDGEFAVIDTWSKEKAWFEMPFGCTPDMVDAMIASSFNAGPFRISNKIWCV